MEGETVKFGRTTFVGMKGSNLKDNYEVIKKLGKGGYGQVYQVRNKKSNELFACKKLSKLDINNLEKFEREIKILIQTDHPNIIKLYDVYTTTNSLYLIMEECHGGELFDKILEHIENQEMYTEKEAAEIILQVMSAVEYCHNNGIVHRDLKPENLLYLKKGNEKNNPLKVIDFGLSQTLNTKKILSSKVGTAYYVSPEILAGKYNEKCDIWSCGVILYVLLSGEPPFNGPSDGVIYSKIKKMKFTFPKEKWNCISKEAKDLLSHMLAPEDERYTASQVLAHPWFKIINEIPLEKLNFNSHFFKEYKDTNQLKKIVLLYIASRIKESDINDLKEIFKAFDKDNDGQINYNEFEQGLLKLNSNDIKKEEIHSYFTSIDTDQNGKIDYTEFLASTLQKKIFLKEEKLYEAFSMFDKDNTGKITKNDLMSVLKLENKNDQYVNDLIKHADKNGDGVIDYKEFLEFMGFKK
jgi:calcium-dependent protein kinase